MYDKSCRRSYSVVCNKNLWGFPYKIQHQNIASGAEFRETLNKSLKAALGDINGDGNITIADAIMLRKHIANIITLDGDTLTVADVTKDGAITIADAIMLQKYIANIITEL